MQYKIGAATSSPSSLYVFTIYMYRASHFSFSMAVAHGICLHIYCGALRTSDQQQDQDWNSASRLRLHRCIIFMLFDITPMGLYLICMYMSPCQGHLFWSRCCPRLSSRTSLSCRLILLLLMRYELPNNWCSCPYCLAAQQQQPP